MARGLERLERLERLVQGLERQERPPLPKSSRCRHHTGECRRLSFTQPFVGNRCTCNLDLEQRALPENRPLASRPASGIGAVVQDESYQSHLMLNVALNMVSNPISVRRAVHIFPPLSAHAYTGETLFEHIVPAPLAFFIFPSTLRQQTSGRCWTRNRTSSSITDLCYHRRGS
jgi:hypothetical protein